MFRLHGQITWELLGLRMRNFHKHKHIRRFSNLDQCTFKVIKHVSNVLSAAFCGTVPINGTKYSRMDHVKFVKDSL